jgi:hypothetical protein
MSAIREAIVLPLLFLTIALLAGARIHAQVALVPPSLFSLVLATMLIAALVRSGALAPDRLLNATRSTIANANGAVVLFALFAATAQILAMLTPATGLPLLFVDIFLFVTLLNTLVAMPDRVRLLRSLAVTLISALLLKFVILASLSAPAASRTSRVLAALFDAATFGSITQDPQPVSAGYLAFFTVAMYLVAIVLLPPPRAPGGRPPGDELEAASRMQSIRA